MSQGPNLVLKNEDKASLGIGLILIANLFFSFVDTSSKWLALAGFAAVQLAFMRYLSHFIINVGIELYQGKGRRNPFATPMLGATVFRALMLATSTTLNFLAITYLPLTLTATIMFSTPLIVCVLSVPLLNERVGPYRWGAIALGFFGVIIAIRPFDADFNWAVFFSLSAATTFALYSIMTRKLAGVVPIDTQQFYAGLVGTVILLPLCVFQWNSPSNGLDWALLWGMGVFAWAGHQFLTSAHRFAPANLLMPFTYSFMIYLTIWSFFVFDHIPDTYTLIGAGLIFVSGLIIWLRERA